MCSKKVIVTSGKEANAAFQKTLLYKKYLAREIKRTQKRPGFKKSLKDLKKRTDRDSLKGPNGDNLVREWVDFCNRWDVDITSSRIVPRLPVEFPIPFKVVDGRCFPDPEKKGTVIFKRAVSRREYDDLWPLINHYLKTDFVSGVKPGPKCDEQQKRAIYDDYLEYLKQGKSKQKAYELLTKIHSRSESRIRHIISEYISAEKSHIKLASRRPRLVQ